MSPGGHCTKVNERVLEVLGETGTSVQWGNTVGCYLDRKCLFMDRQQASVTLGFLHTSSSVTPGSHPLRSWSKCLSLTYQATSANTTIASLSPGQVARSRAPYSHVEAESSENELSGPCLYHILGSSRHGRKTSNVLKGFFYRCLYSTRPLSSRQTEYFL